MKIKWLEDAELEAVTNFDEETEELDTENVIIRKGEEDDVDALAYHKDVQTAGFQFGNGSCVYGVPMSLFEIIEGKEELEAMI